MKAVKHVLIVLFIAIFVSSQPLLAAGTSLHTGKMMGAKWPEIDRFLDRVYENWAPSKKIPEGKVVELAVGIANDGKLYDLKIEASSGDAQLDADCVQAVMGASACSPINGREGELVLIRIWFNSKTKVGHSNSGISKYFATRPEQEHDHIAFYRIPLDVLKRYPGLFTENELLDDSNIGTTQVIDKHPGLPWWGVDHLRAIYQGTWAPFFIAFPSATKERILEIRDKLPFDDRHPIDHSS